VAHDFTQGSVTCGTSGPDTYRVCIPGHFGTPNEFVAWLVESGRSPRSGAFHPKTEPELREKPDPLADSHRQRHVLKQNGEHKDNSAAASSLGCRAG
jgi:hypothetical protein